jgi:hypothetical protein
MPKGGVTVTATKYEFLIKKAKAYLKIVQFERCISNYLSAHQHHTPHSNHLDINESLKVKAVLAKLHHHKVLKKASKVALEMPSLKLMIGRKLV